MYNWGSVGRKAELASVLQRIDFGQPDMTAEGVAAARSAVQPLGALQRQVIALFEARLRRAFGPSAWGGELDAPPLAPNMLQFTRISPSTCLGNHYDRRDKWQEGIASIAWSDDAGVHDARGDDWTLQMQLGSGASQRTITQKLPAGAAYILTGHAQGRTEVCLKKCVAHAACPCCWTHGIWNENVSRARPSHAPPARARPEPAHRAVPRCAHEARARSGVAGQHRAPVDHDAGVRLRVGPRDRRIIMS